MSLVDNKWTVYVHINKINKKKYIGITSCNPASKRWGSNGINYRGCIKFWNAIQKYGWDEFDHIIYLDNIDIETANKIEEHLIRLFDSIKNGYNQEPGGVLQGPRSPEAIQKLREARLKQVITPEMYKIGAEKRKGRKHSKEWSNNIKNGKWANSRNVMCIETNTIYSCIAEASEKIGIRYFTIYNSAQRNKDNVSSRKRGFHWKYV